MIKSQPQSRNKTFKLKYQLNKVRKRKNSKFERSKTAIEQSEQFSHRIGDLTVQATRQHQLLDLKPFMGEHQQLFNLSKHHQNLESSSSAINTKPIYTEESRSRLIDDCQVQSPRRNLKRLLTKKFDDIINPEKFNGQFAAIDLQNLKKFKISEERMRQEYIAETNKIKQDQLNFKQKIQSRFFDKFPERREYLNQFSNLYYMTPNKNKSARNMTDKLNRTENSLPKRNTAFYSRSRKKCFVERFLEQEQESRSASKDLEKIKSFTFMEYLGNESARKEFKSKSKSRKNIRCTTLMKIQDDILKIARTGTKGEALIKKCLDQVIVQNLLR